MKQIISFALLFFVLQTKVSAEPMLKVQQAWSPEAPPVAKVMAGYLTLVNNGNKKITIVKSESPLFSRVEIHSMEMKDGMMSMKKLEQVSIDSKASLKLKPGNLHLMLIGPKNRVLAGNKIPVTLHFKNGGTFSFELDVNKNNPHENHHHH